MLFLTLFPFFLLFLNYFLCTFSLFHSILLFLSGIRISVSHYFSLSLCLSSLSLSRFQYLACYQLSTTTTNKQAGKQTPDARLYFFEANGRVGGAGRGRGGSEERRRRRSKGENDTNVMCGSRFLWLFVLVFFLANSTTSHVKRKITSRGRQRLQTGLRTSHCASFRRLYLVRGQFEP